MHASGTVAEHSELFAHQTTRFIKPLPCCGACRLITALQWLACILFQYFWVANLDYLTFMFK
jgi:hypothetical protein